MEKKVSKINELSDCVDNYVQNPSDEETMKMLMASRSALRELVSLSRPILKFKKLHEMAIIPSYKHDFDSGFDSGDAGDFGAGDF